MNLSIAPGFNREIKIGYPVLIGRINNKKLE